MAHPKDEPQQTVTLTLSDLNTLIDARARETVANILSAKAPDQEMAERMDRQRGKHLPPMPESLVPCRSPITGATMSVRVLKSRSFPDGRIVEMLDYVRPDGWDRKKKDGGLYMDGDSFPMLQDNGKPHMKYTKWLYQSFWQRDWNALSGQPASFLDQWRVAREDKAAE
jgi:hypothetical protein